MKCPKCGFEDPAAKLYCPNCGSMVQMSTSAHMAALAEEKRKERESEVLAGLLKWLIGAVALLIVLFAARSVLSDLPAEPVQAHFPPPYVELTESRKLSITPAMLPVPRLGAIRYREVKQDEDTVIESLLAKVLARAPLYRIGGPRGRTVRGFIIKRYGRAVTFFSREGKKIYAAGDITPLD